MAAFVLVVVPPGFMPARTPFAPALAICTGHGALDGHVLDLGHSGKRRSGAGGPICAFSGVGGPLSTSASTAAISLQVAYARPPMVELVDLQPGRGLAAPPPPSQAPPASSL
jgi:hypothetical protein